MSLLLENKLINLFVPPGTIIDVIVARMIVVLFYGTIIVFIVI